MAHPAFPTVRSAPSNHENRREGPFTLVTCMLELPSSAVEEPTLAEVALASDQSQDEASVSRALLFQPDRSSPVNRRILVVEDDQPLSRFLCRTLNLASHQAEMAHDGTTALEILSPAIDLMILDINLPGLNGFGVLRALRPLYPKLPVLVLTARSHMEDMVEAFASGADDCLVKPFSYIELLARVGALLRRNVGVLPRSSQVSDLTLSREEHRVDRNGRKIELTPREFDLLEFLMRTPGVPVARATLMEEVWGTESDPSTNVIDVYMKYLRDKIDRPDELKLIRTVRGVGYVVSAE